MATKEGKRRRKSVEIWGRIQRRAEDGERFADLAEEFGVKLDTIRKRSQVKQWATPGRIERREAREAACRLHANDFPSAGESEGQTQPGCNSNQVATSDPGPLDPKAEQAATAEYAAAMLERGRRGELGASEYRTWYEIHRKATGLDKDAGGEQGFLSPLGALARTVEPGADPDPIDGFPL